MQTGTSVPALLLVVKKAVIASSDAKVNQTSVSLARLPFPNAFLNNSSFQLISALRFHGISLDIVSTNNDPQTFIYVMEAVFKG